MITKKAYIELVRDRINGEYESKHLGKLSNKKIDYYISLAYNSALVGMFTKGLVSYENYTKEYQDVAIIQDTNTDVYYSVLPAPIIVIPRRAGSGIVRISGMNSSSVEYVPMTNGDFKVIDGLEVDLIDDVVGYIFKHGRIEYYGMTTELVASTVKMELVIPFEEYNDTDYVQIPTGTDDMIIKNIIQMLMGQPDADRLNNGNTVNKNTLRNG